MQRIDFLEVKNHNKRPLKYLIESNKNPMDVRVDLVSKRPNTTLKTVVYDAETKHLILERSDIFNGNKTVILKLPLTGNKIIIETFNVLNGRQPLGKDQSFETKNAKIMRLKTFNVDLGTGDKEFMEFAKKIAVELPRLNPDGKLRMSPSGKFKIVVFDKLKSYSGDVLPTPAMVGKRTGTIEISKDYMLEQSQSQRIATLSHEYAHKYKNPLMGLDIGDEVGADLNGLAIYLGNGFSLYGYVNAFRKIFNGAQSAQNTKRYSVLKGFAKKIYDGEYFGKPYNL